VYGLRNAQTINNAFVKPPGRIEKTNKSNSQLAIPNQDTAWNCPDVLLIALVVRIGPNLAQHLPKGLSARKRVFSFRRSAVAALLETHLFNNVTFSSLVLIFRLGEFRMRLVQQLWSDENGFIVSSELILIATILVIAMVVGLQTVRDAVLQELGDVGGAIGNISQDYSYGGATGHASTINGSLYVDAEDFCEVSTGNGRNCINVGITATANE
jgi:Flp pilus assembly pilin Flp